MSHPEIIPLGIAAVGLLVLLVLLVLLRRSIKRTFDMIEKNKERRQSHDEGTNHRGNRLRR